MIVKDFKEEFLKLKEVSHEKDKWGYYRYRPDDVDILLVVFNTKEDIQQFFTERDEKYPIDRPEYGEPYIFIHHKAIHNYREKRTYTSYDLMNLAQFYDRHCVQYIEDEEKKINRIKAKISDIENVGINILRIAAEHQAPTA